MGIVAGVDFGTLSVRVSIVSSDTGLLASAVAEYPLHRKREDPEHATQSHKDHMRALVEAIHEALRCAAINGDRIEAIALDTTGSSVVPVDKNLQPLGEYYLWCDHRAKGEAAEITETAHREKLEAIQWCGGVYSSEWGFSKLLHWLRHNPEKRSQFPSAFEHCDMVAATLSGITDPHKVKRSICAMGHKWLWNATLGGLPTDSFLTKVDPLLAGVREKLEGEYATSDRIAGNLSLYWAEQLGLKLGIPIPVGAVDAHWDAIGAGCRTDDGECRRNIHLHHWHHSRGKSSTRRLRRGARESPSEADRHRGRLVCRRRHLSGDCRPRRYRCSEPEQGPRELPTRTNWASPAHMGQRRSHRAGEPKSAARRTLLHTLNNQAFRH